MIRIPRTLVLCPLLALSATVTASAPPPVSHAAHAHAAHVDHAVPGQGKTAAGRRWKADAPLRAGMARVRTLTDALAHLEHGHLNPAQVRAAADEIRAAVNTMFAQCRLAPEPDAALHPLLARTLAASQALRDHPADPAPVAALRIVLSQYQELFDERGGPIAPN